MRAAVTASPSLDPHNQGLGHWNVLAAFILIGLYVCYAGRNRRRMGHQNRGHTLTFVTAQCYFRGAVWSVLAGFARVVLVSGETR